MSAKKEKKKGSATTPSFRDCANCGAPEGSIPGSPTHYACGRCLITYYCGNGCQKEHWKKGGHKEHCVKREDRSACGTPKDDSGGGSGEGAGGANEDFGAGEEPECAICLEPLSQSPSQVLPCSHAYHRECVEQLRSFGVNEACPMCRAELPPGPKKLYEDAIRRWHVLDKRYGQHLIRGSHYGQAQVPLRDCHYGPFCSITDDDDRRECDEVMRMVSEAAEQGYVMAQYNLGNMYHFGQGMAKNETLAVKWYHKAAEQGYARAQFNLGNSYVRGMGITKNESTAIKWFRKAADQGDAWSQYVLGDAYAKGLGVPQNFPGALLWLRKAEAQGIKQVTGCIRDIFERYPKAAAEKAARDAAMYSQALKWFRQVEAEHGHIEGMGERTRSSIQDMLELQRQSQVEAAADAAAAAAAGLTPPSQAQLDEAHAAMAVQIEKEESKAAAAAAAPSSSAKDSTKKKKKKKKKGKK